MTEKREAHNLDEMELLFEKRTTYVLIEIEIITFPLTFIKANSIIRSRLIYSTLTFNLSKHTPLIRKNSSLLRPTILPARKSRAFTWRAAEFIPEIRPQHTEG